jgi:hypothetical protein
MYTLLLLHVFYEQLILVQIALLEKRRHYGHLRCDACLPDGYLLSTLITTTMFKDGKEGYPNYDDLAHFRSK